MAFVLPNQYFNVVIKFLESKIFTETAAVLTYNLKKSKNKILSKYLKFNVIQLHHEFKIK